MTETALTVRKLCKAFASTQALSDVDLVVGPSEVHAVLGENGAGKSTLMHILAGLERADSGEVQLPDGLLAPKTPEQARRRGVALVPQEPELALHLSVEENIVLGSEPGRFGFIDRALMRERARGVLAQVAHDGELIDPTRSATSLSPSERQRVVIARSLCVDSPRVLILDEPTSSLTARDVEQLFLVITRLKQRGLSILYVSHFLEEVMQIADRYTVLRDGRVAGGGAIADSTPDGLIRLMAGTSMSERARRSNTNPGKVVLRVDQLAGVPLPRDASLELRAGQVLGIFGLVGAGRTELLRALFGLDAVKSGAIEIGVHAGPASPKRRLAQGVAMLSEDRKGEGLAQALSIRANLTLSRLGNRLIRPSEERRKASQFAQQLGIRCSNVDQRVSELSGGNQQKVALARLLYHDPDVLLLDEPTRGIDVRSRAEVHRVIDAWVARGKAVLVVSSYLPELFAIADDIAVMCRGRLGPARPTHTLSEHAVLREASGA